MHTAYSETIGGPAREAPAQHDNLLGVCAALGEASGIDPLVFRLAFVAAMLSGFFEMTVLAYCVAAAAIMVARR